MILKYDCYIKWNTFPLEFVSKDEHNGYDGIEPEKIFKVYFAYFPKCNLYSVKSKLFLSCKNYGNKY